MENPSPETKPDKATGLAIASVIMGGLTVFLSFLAIPAIICGAIVLVKGPKGKSQNYGRAGIILALVWLAFSLILRAFL